jgi:glutathione S-transferase
MASLTLYHAVPSRAQVTRWMLEELGEPYDVHLLNLGKGDNRKPEYLAINPMGKVPAILHDGVLVSEEAAVYMYVAELYPQAGLAPSIGDPLRGPYLRWMVFYGSCFEPAVVDRSQKTPPAPPSTCPYGDFDTMLNTVSQQLTKGPYIVGDKFTAADVLWGMALKWTTGFKLVPELPPIKAYIDRVNSRPALVRAAKKDEEIAAAQG